jgi:hypothetical protein
MGMASLTLPYTSPTTVQLKHAQPSLTDFAFYLTAACCTAEEKDATLSSICCVPADTSAFQSSSTGLNFFSLYVDGPSGLLASSSDPLIDQLSPEDFGTVGALDELTMVSLESS